MPALVTGLDAVKVILFGSVAGGDASEGSDIDLLVISGEKLDHLSWNQRMDKAYDIRNSLQGSVYPLDLVVWSSEELAHKLRQNSAFVQQVMRHGMVLYER